MHLEPGLQQLTLFETLIGFTFYLFAASAVLTLLCLVINSIFRKEKD